MDNSIQTRQDVFQQLQAERDARDAALAPAEEIRRTAVKRTENQEGRTVAGFLSGEEVREPPVAEREPADAAARGSGRV